MVIYLLDANQAVNHAERKFNVAFSLISTTEKELNQARRNFQEYSNFLEIASSDSVYKPELQKEVRTAQVEIRHYERRIQRLERELEIYRQAKNQAEEEWKQLVSQGNRRIAVFDPVRGENEFTFWSGGLAQYN